MDAVLLMVVVFVGYILAYKIYGNFLGKKIYGRLNLTRLFKNDYHLYSNGEGVSSSND